MYLNHIERRGGGGEYLNHRVHRFPRTSEIVVHRRRKCSASILPASCIVVTVLYNSAGLWIQQLRFPA